MGFNEIEYGLFKRYGTNPVSCLAGSVEKRHYHSASSKGFVSYSAFGGLALVLGEPICPPEKMKRVVTEFHQHCRKQGMHEAYFCALGESSARFPQDEFSRIHMGDEALVQLKSRAYRKNARRMIRRAKREGVTLQELQGKDFASPRFKKESESITRHWLKNKGNSLITFMVNNNFDGHPCHQRIFLAKREGKTIGFMTAYNVPSASAMYMDITRIGKAAPNGTSELMVSSLTDIAEAEGYSLLSLGMVPLSDVGKKWRNPLLLKWILSALYEYGGWLYPSKTEFHFKSKFQPHWRPVYAYCSKKANILDFYNMFRIFQPLSLKDYLLRHLFGF